MNARPKNLYKVVKRKSRYSAMVHGGSEFAIKYEKGKEVKAKKGTIGIMSFTKHKYALDFISAFNDYNQLTVIRIRPTSPVSIKRKVCSVPYIHDTGEILKRYYNETTETNRRRFHTDAWKGTVVCDSAKVLS